MFRYQENTFQSMQSQARPVSSLSSGSADSGIFFSTGSSSATPLSSHPNNGSVAAVTTPEDINNLQNQRAHLLAVNAQLRKEIEQVRSAAGSANADAVHSQEALLFESQNFQNGRHPSGKKSPKPDSYKTVMCQAWLSSKICQFAENCRFAHGETELRPSRIQPKQNNKYKTKLCDKYTSSGLCPYGKRCHFIHPDNGNNSYIRPDKLIEVSQRHALADLCLPAQQPDRPVTPSDLAPLAGLAPSSVPLGPTPSRSSAATAAHLRPHPSWPLEPATFFNQKNEEEPFVHKPLFGNDILTPARISLVSSGFASGGSSPADSVSPFSTASSSQELHHPVMLSSEDERDFEFFKISGLDNLAEEVTRNLELW